ncbi:AraC family transcriptional regulator [Lactobacillus sp. ESL0731]|uniref:AraC family transcriptional regulator n=1 Tax=unclassified Lactobacillus TaxID=2620435 RepID=UPI0023F9BD94|nr:MULTISPECIES: AraC family transcriptional regulator [unclassified Lactobacillus]WEV50644.1 AraC family transcriptional regulator [Lactobacillus sp. ESL0700]WEV61774.1 AraC family transcriptional regulator [Lactobacillus sp. ESL0731]
MTNKLINYLRTKNHQRSWDDVFAEIKDNGKIAHKVRMVDGEPVYQFYDTYSDDLILNSSAITISVQPVESFIPFHIHDYVEIMIPLVEDCEIVLEHTKIKVKQEDIIFMGNQTIHQVKPISKKGIVVNIALKTSAFSLNELNFLQAKESGSAISNLLFSLLSDEEYGEGRYSLFELNHNQKIVDLVYDIIGEYYFPEIQSDQIIKLEMLTLFSRLIRQVNYSDIKVKSNQRQKNNLLSLLLYIERNYKDITLTEMAANFGFNPNYLSDYLQKHTGKTFINLVHLQRVNVAARYLSYTNASIAKISNKVGYENPSYFYKIFKKYFGMSPAEYRLNTRSSGVSRY